MLMPASALLPQDGAPLHAGQDLFLEARQRRVAALVRQRIGRGAADQRHLHEVSPRFDDRSPRFRPAWGRRAPEANELQLTLHNFSEIMTADPFM
jgi:hypothetical protein